MTDAQYWSLDAPGLTNEAAERLASFLEEGYGIEAIPVDPDRWLTLHLDPSSIYMLRESLRIAMDSGELDSAHTPGLQSMFEDLEEWIFRH